MIAGRLNQYLALALKRSPRAQELSTTLEGRRLKVSIDGFPAAIWICASAGTLHLALGNGGEDPADVSVHGSPAALLGLIGSATTNVTAQSSVEVSGDEQLALHFQQLARLLRPDFETLAGSIVGRIPAHLATRTLGALTTWGRSVAHSVVRNVGEYLAHESQDLVPRAEAESFFAGVEDLRRQLNLLDTRVAQLAVGVDDLASRTLRAAL